MRDRRQPRSSSERTRILPGLTEATCVRVQPQVSRIFTPDEIDLDDLAEAIRSLLDEPRGNSRNRPQPDLLSSSPRGTHVVEANEAP